MRAIALAVVILMLAPAAGALVVPRAAAPIARELSDGDVLLLMAREKGLEPRRLAVPTPAPADDIPALLQRLAARGGASMSAHDARAFDTLHPALAPPILTLLVAIEQAWILRDAAFAGIDVEAALAREELSPEERAALPPVLSPEQEEDLVTAAILLSDTLDGVVLPALDALADAPVWPPIPLADPVGVLRVGSAGNDLDTLERLVTIDGTGNDVYRNNAGGTRWIDDTNPATLGYPIALALDLRGDDRYGSTGTSRAQGSGSAGIGLLVDRSGNDGYQCSRVCQGYSVIGVGLLRDHAGHDFYRSWDAGIGSTDLVALFRDDEGNDYYETAVAGVGYAEDTGFALFWDLGGQDKYVAVGSSLSAFGYATGDARGWLVEEGVAVDMYRHNATNSGFPGRCNDCVWKAGTSLSASAGGRGNDNAGGLPYLFARQDTH